jgi:hypothetical protein
MAHPDGDSFLALMFGAWGLVLLVCIGGEALAALIIAGCIIYFLATGLDSGDGDQ